MSRAELGCHQVSLGGRVGAVALLAQHSAQRIRGVADTAY
jgi:hypothetical protein